MRISAPQDSSLHKGDDAMTEVVTPSKTITKGQAGKFVDVFIDALVKSWLPSEPTQQVLEEQGAALAAELVAVVRKYVEIVNSIIVRRVPVNILRTAEQALDATGRKQYTDSDVVAAMPKGAGGEVEVHFFKLDRYISDNDLEDEYASRGLKPADPCSLAAVNEANPAFADEHPNGTHWKDAKGKWCFASFNRWDDERELCVDRNDGGWFDSWWFAGVRK